MVNNCKICSRPFEGEKQLHAHLKSHRITLGNYYQQYYPRQDLLTGEFIEFKNKEQYFESDFNNKINFKKWAKNSDPKIVGEYCKKLLIKRKEKKKSIYPFSQVELKSAGLPSINFLESVIGDYYKFCGENGFEQKFFNINNLHTENNLSNNFSICIDTREHWISLPQSR